MKTVLNKVKNNAGIVIIFLIIDMIVVAAGFWNKELNSDVSNHILQAKDILSGNILYRNWNLSKISFLTGDMIFYEIAVLLKGVSYSAAVTANALMALAVQLTLFATCLYGKKRGFFEKLCIIVLIAVPSIGLLRSMMMHTGCWIYCMVLYMVYDHIYGISADEKKLKKYSVLFVCVQALGIFGDFLIFLYGALPCLLYSLIEGYREEKKEERIRHLKTAALNIYGSVTAYVLMFLYFGIGGANRCGHVLGLQFLPALQWRSKLDSLFIILMDMFGADFTGRKALLPDTILRCFNFMILLVGIFFVVFSAINYLRKKYDDRFSVILDIAIFVSAGTYIFTTRSASRYITDIALFLYILIVRNIHIIWARSGHNLKINRILAACIVLFAMMGHGWGLAESSRIIVSDPHRELVGFLNEHGLTNGYSSFWNASVSTVLSEEAVCIRHVEKNTDGGIAQFVWFGKDTWYEEESHFVVIDNSNGDRGASDSYELSEENCISYFGKADTVYEVGKYIILVYDRDISKELAIPDKKSSHL